jgi:hypothetical protein
MSGNRSYKVVVPVITWVDVFVTAQTPAEALDKAGAIANQRVADNQQDYEKVVDSSELAWILANTDGSSPKRFESIWQPKAKDFVWGEKGTLKRGYGY